MSDEKPVKRPSRNPDGAPSKYKPEFEQLLIEHMSKGYSFESFQVIAGVCEDTLHDWVKKHPGWKEAKTKAFAACLLFWERLGIDHILNESQSFGEGQSQSKSLNGSVWIFNMKNRFKWRDRQKDETDPVNINLTLADKLAKARARSGKK